MSETINEKHIRMYMKMARTCADPEHNSCLSRSIGVVVVQTDRPGGRVVSTGYNGPASGLPRPDSEDHLRNVVAPSLKEEDWRLLLDGDEPDPLDEDPSCKHLTEWLVHQQAGCGVCPRRMIGCASGERLELCSCQHAESNAISRASESLQGAWMFCWCGVPCWRCSADIIQAGIEHVMCIDWGFEYSQQSRWMLERAGVVLTVRNSHDFENNLQRTNHA